MRVINPTILKAKYQSIRLEFNHKINFKYVNCRNLPATFELQIVMRINAKLTSLIVLACIAAGQFLDGEGKDRLPGFLMFLNCQSTGGLEIRDWLKSKLAVTGSHQSKFSCNCKSDYSWLFPRFQSWISCNWEIYVYFPDNLKFRHWLRFTSTVFMPSSICSPLFWMLTYMKIHK